jgi:hypothetical protein
MFTRKGIVIALLSAALSTGVSLAQSISFSYRQAGNLVGAVAGGTGANQSWGVNLTQSSALLAGTRTSFLGRLRPGRVTHLRLITHILRGPGSPRS